MENVLSCMNLIKPPIVWGGGHARIWYSETVSAVIESSSGMFWEELSFNLRSYLTDAAQKFRNIVQHSVSRIIKYLCLFGGTILHFKKTPQKTPKDALQLGT